MDSEFSRKKLLVFGTLFLVVLAIPITVYTALQTQDTRTRATFSNITPTPRPSATPTPTLTPSVSPTPTICPVPDQVTNVKINCPNCFDENATPTPTEQPTS